MKHLTMICTSLMIVGLMFAGKSYAQIDPQTILGVWLLDEGTGDITVDASGNGNDGTLMNTPTWIDGVYGKALDFAGSSSYVDCGNAEALNVDVFSVSFWCNIPSTQSWNHIVSRGQHVASGSPGSVNWGVMMYDGAQTILFESFNDTGWTGITAGTTTGEWHHVVATYDGNTDAMQLYHDGGLAATGSEGMLLDGDRPFVIGARSDDGFIDGFFSGSIDEVGYFNTILPAEDIEVIMDCGLAEAISGEAYAKARGPDPANGATGVTSPLLGWNAGADAMWHDVYLGTDQIAVTNATSSDPMGPAEVYKGRQPLAWAMYFQPGGWTSGTTYYWRIDEVEADGTTIHTGDVWSFTAAPLEAYNPDPRDGARWVGLNHTLTWLPGAGAVTHDVYFGTDEAEVTNGTGVTFIGNQPDAFYVPGTLAPETTYYWRIDGKDNFGTMYPGAVWSFTTVGPYAGAQGFYYEWTSATVPPDPSVAFANLVMTRIDPQIDFYWGSGSPAGIRAEQFAARWVADLEAPTSEPYTIWTLTDDGIRVWLDGVLVIDNWTEHGDTWNSSQPIDFVAGQTYSLEMEWFENSGGAVAELHWSSSSTPRQPIPSGALQLPLKASNPNPANGATDVTDTPTLRWKAGEQAAQHQIFFGTDRDTVANADTTTVGIYRGTQSLENTSYVPTEAPLEWEKTYYWKVNEANGVDLWGGSVWSFTVANFLIIDDFEDYDDFCNRVFYTWEEGGGYSVNPDCGILPSPGNGTGSLGGYGAAPYAEQTITHDGSFQSMPFEYLNDGSTGKALYSETERAFDPAQDWTRHDVKALTLWFRGNPGSVGSFNYDPAADIYRMTADGWDISGTADGFHYAYKQLSGVGSIQAQVLGVQNTNEWAKAGVMIREDLDPNSAHAMAFVTPGNGVVFEYRPSKGADNVGAAGQQTGITAPHWVRITRSGNNFTAEHSADGAAWDTLGTPQSVPMAATVYVGLAVTSHDAALTCQATFSDVTIMGTVMGQWQSQDIGITSNDPEQLYVAVEDSIGKSKVVNNPDLSVVQSDTWQEWMIDLKQVSNAGVNLSSVKKLYIGVGDRVAPKLGGSGMLYIDDIRLYQSRCLPWLARPAGDFNNNCIVDYPDLDIMTDNWLVSDYDVAPEDPGNSNLVAYYALQNSTNDGSGNGHHGDPCGAPTYVAGPAGYGTAMHFDGTSAGNYVDLGTFDPSAATGELTVAVWAKWDGLSGYYQGLVGKRDSWSAGDMLWNIEANVNTGALGFFREGSYPYDGDPVLPVGQWAHVAASFDGTTASFYINGELTGSGPFSFGSDTEARVVFGAVEANGNNPFNGALDELRIYDRGLTQGQVAWLAGRATAYTQPLYLLLVPPDPAMDMDTDGMIDLKDYAVLVDMWLDEILWP